MANNCSNCGFEYNDGDLFCSRCGNKLSENDKFDIRTSISKFNLSTKETTNFNKNIYNNSIIKTRGYSPIDKIKTALEIDKINIPKPQLLTV